MYSTSTVRYIFHRQFPLQVNIQLFKLSSAFSFLIAEYLGDQADEVNQTLIQMRTDQDRDVRIIAGGVAGKYYPQGVEWKGSQKVPEVETDGN